MHGNHAACNWAAGLCICFHICKRQVFSLLSSYVVVGVERFYKDIQLMIGHRPHKLWSYAWKYVTPVAILVGTLILTRLLTDIQAKANSVDPDQTTPRGAVSSGSAMFAMESFKPNRLWIYAWRFASLIA